MKIFADSSCDLPKEYYKQHEVEFLPFRICLNGSEYEDGISMDSKQIYEAIRKGAQPKISQVSPALFLSHFKQLAQNGEEGLYIAFSSELSGTYSTAMMIRNQLQAQNPTFKLAIIDSKCASLGLGFLIQEAVRLRDTGHSLEEMEKKITVLASQMEHLFLVEDLDYVAKGGRVSKASAFLGGLLNSKPILHVEDGKLVPIEKVRGRKKAMARILELMQKRGGSFTDQIVGIGHSDDSSFANELKEAIQTKLAPKAIQTTTIGSVSGSYVGPGTVAVFFTNSNTPSK